MHFEGCQAALVCISWVLSVTREAYKSTQGRSVESSRKTHSVTAGTSPSPPVSRRLSYLHRWVSEPFEGRRQVLWGMCSLRCQRVENVGKKRAEQGCNGVCVRLRKGTMSRQMGTQRWNQSAGMSDGRHSQAGSTWRPDLHQAESLLCFLTRI